MPDTISNDSGPQFISAAFAAFVEGGGLNTSEQLYTIGYTPYPIKPSGSERNWQTAFHSHWCCRATPYAMTGCFPVLLILGHNLQLPLDRIHPRMRDTPAMTPSLGDRAAEQQHCMKQRFDRKHWVKCTVLTVSYWVCIHRPNQSHKLYADRSLHSWDLPLSAWPTARVGMPDALHW